MLANWQPAGRFSFGISAHMERLYAYTSSDVGVSICPLRAAKSTPSHVQVTRSHATSDETTSTQTPDKTTACGKPQVQKGDILEV